MDVSHITVIKHLFKASFEHHAIIKTSLCLSTLSPPLTDQFLCSPLQPNSPISLWCSPQSLPHLSWPLLALCPIRLFLPPFHPNSSVKVTMGLHVSKHNGHFSVFIFSATAHLSFSLEKLFFSWFPGQHTFLILLYLMNCSFSVALVFSSSASRPFSWVIAFCPRFLSLKKIYTHLMYTTW